MRDWGDTAERLAWTVDGLFGLHPTVPLSRVDRMGALWLCKGERVADLTQTTARFDRGLAFYRRPVGVERASTLWPTVLQNFS